MRYKSEWYRGRAPSPVDSTHILIRKTVTKEKTSNWDWGRASQASSVSSISEAPRSASPLKVAFYRSSSRSRSRHRRPTSHKRHYSYHDDNPQDDFHSRAYRQSADEHRHHRRHSRRYSEDAPRVEEKRVAHKSCLCQENHSLPTASHHICPPPILLAVPIRPSRKMEEVGGFTYEEWCKRRECVAVATETIAPKSSISNRSNNTRSEVSDQDNAYRYAAMREPGPQDAVPVAYALYPQPGYTYMYPPQQLQPQQLQAMVAPPPPAPAPVVAPSSHSKQEEAHYRHYTHERVRERSVRPISEPPTVEKVAPPKAAPPPAVPQVTMAGMTYGAYPFGYPTAAVPVAYAMPNYPVPMHSETASTVTPKATKDRVWVGRTKKQVDEDNAKIAHKEGVYKPNEMVPKGASSDQLFWVIEPDNTNTLRNFRTIEDDLQPGKWKVDPRYGNAYFVRDKPEKK